MLVILMAAGLFGATAVPPADVGVASRAYDACLDGAAQARDDGKTNPRFLARRVALQCRPELNRLVMMATDGRSDLIREQLYQEKLRQEEGLAAEAIVRHRQADGASR